MSAASHNNMTPQKCHPPMVEFCEKCGEWAAPAGPTPVEREVYHRKLITFEEAMNLLNVDEDVLRRLDIPTASYCVGHYDPARFARWLRQQGWKKLLEYENRDAEGRRCLAFRLVS